MGPRVEIRMSRGFLYITPGRAAEAPGDSVKNREGNKMDSDLEKLMPNTERIVIGGRGYEVGRLRIGQSIMLGRIITKALAKFSEEDKERIQGGSNNAEDVFTFFDMVDEKTVLEVMGVILREKDINFLGGALDLGGTAKIIQVILKYNDFGKMWGNVLAAMEEVKKQTLSPRSSGSPQLSPGTR